MLSSSLKQTIKKQYTQEELLELDKEELVERILKLQTHSKQLQNIINKSIPGVNNIDEKKRDHFDFSKCHYRKIFLRFMYFGWDYHGLAVQDSTSKTIEHELFVALTRSCLIKSRETSQYNRCGRTDKGVSSFGQVVSLSIRSKFPPEQQYDPASIAGEMSYCKILNRILPKDIRVIAWVPVPQDKPDLSARFDCIKRKYKYYFPRSDLDIQAMREACKHLVGSHDFRNLCKMDIGNGVLEYRRVVVAADIENVTGEGKDPQDMLCLAIEGNAFLWHQIRCIMGVLLLVGGGRESPGVVKELLDVEKNARKPQYNIALDVPLNLFRCVYSFEDHQDWVYDPNELKYLISQLQNEWTVQNVKSTMMKDTIGELEKIYQEKRSKETGLEKVEPVNAYADCLTQGISAKVYTPLLKRVTCMSLEERLEKLRKKRKTENPESTECEEESV